MDTPLTDSEMPESRDEASSSSSCGWVAPAGVCVLRVHGRGCAGLGRGTCGARLEQTAAWPVHRGACLQTALPLSLSPLPRPPTPPGSPTARARRSPAGCARRPPAPSAGARRRCAAAAGRPPPQAAWAPRPAAPPPRAPTGAPAAASPFARRAAAGQRGRTRAGPAGHRRPGRLPARPALGCARRPGGRRVVRGGAAWWVRALVRGGARQPRQARGQAPPDPGAAAGLPKLPPSPASPPPPHLVEDGALHVQLGLPGRRRGRRGGRRAGAVSLPGSPARRGRPAAPCARATRCPSTGCPPALPCPAAPSQLSSQPRPHLRRRRSQSIPWRCAAPCRPQLGSPAGGRAGQGAVTVSR